MVTCNQCNDYVRTLLFLFCFHNSSFAIVQNSKFKHAWNITKAAVQPICKLTYLSVELKSNLGHVVTLDLFGVILCPSVATSFCVPGWLRSEMWLVLRDSLRWSNCCWPSLLTPTLRRPSSHCTAKRTKESATLPHSILRCASTDEHCRASVRFFLPLPLHLAPEAVPFCLWKFPLCFFVVVFFCIKKSIRSAFHWCIVHWSTLLLLCFPNKHTGS